MRRHSAIHRLIEKDTVGRYLLWISQDSQVILLLLRKFLHESLLRRTAGNLIVLIIRRQGINLTNRVKG